jgi:hypothetical protein
VRSSSGIFIAGAAAGLGGFTPVRGRPLRDRILAAFSFTAASIDCSDNTLFLYRSRQVGTTQQIICSNLDGYEANTGKKRRNRKPCWNLSRTLQN